MSVVRSDGRTSWIQVDAVPVLDSEGRVAQVVSSFIDITERKETEDALQHQALHDTLTGLPNRELLHDRLNQVILSSRRESESLALLMMDLDGFKDVNDTLGHHYGDLLLQEVASRLLAVLRESDTVARMGGDEFAVVLPATEIQGASLTSAKILQALEKPFVLQGQVFDVGGSIGIALWPDHGEDAGTLLRRADVAMYTAKRTGRGYTAYVTEGDQYIPNRLSLISELRYAIDRDDLVLQFQPKVYVATTRSREHMEALVRWRHHSRGIIRPDQFIPLAEQTGLVKPLTLWVLNASLRQCRLWREDGLDLTIAVNLSMRNLHDSQLADTIRQLLATWNGAPNWLELELTEGSLMADPEKSLELLEELHEMGIRITVDDFGTGYSSLAYLKRLPADEIKIDRSFIAGITRDDADAAIVRSTINLAHDLGMEVAAEGVEDQHTRDMLIALRCDAIQGTYVSPPLESDQVPEWHRLGTFRSLRDGETRLA